MPLLFITRITDTFIFALDFIHNVSRAGSCATPPALSVELLSKLPNDRMILPYGDLAA